MEEPAFTLSPPTRQFSSPGVFAIVRKFSPCLCDKLLSVLRNLTYFPDPVAAYDRIARYYESLSEARQAYLDSIENLIVSHMPAGGLSLFDVGAGDGRRALRIAKRAGLHKVVLLEPSAEMARPFSNKVEMWTLRAEELDPGHAPALGRTFDVITCLWNVLGHIRPEERRGQVLGALRAMLSPAGVLFLDVNHRYNVSSYGAIKTALRFLRDRLRPSEFNGDVTAKWDLQDLRCSTYGHVFTDCEIGRLAGSAGLKIHERVVVDYDTGQVRRFGFRGNFFYVLRPRSSASDSARAVHTSSTSASVS